MRLVLTLGDLILLDLRCFERDEPEGAPEHIALGFCSTERSGPYLEDRQGLSEGTE